MFKKIIKSIDYIIIAILIVLFIIGIIALYSANGGSQGNQSEAEKQVVWFFIGFTVMMAIVFIDYEWIAKLWIPIYIVSVISLIAVLFTAPVNGATSWFNVFGVGIQPSEFAKIAIILGLAQIIVLYKKKINKPLTLLCIILFAMIPIFLVVKQPDYGTAMVLVAILAFMLFLGGIDYKYIIVAAILAAISLPMLYNFILPEHAKSRIEVFLNPQTDPQGAGYNIIQAKLAVGSGQLWGMGLFEGNQTQLRIFTNESYRFYICSNR